MPIPYNIWGGDKLWLAYGDGRWTFGPDYWFHHSFLSAPLPPAEKGELWTSHLSLGAPYPPPPMAPYSNPYPYDTYWGTAPDGEMLLYGAAHDHKKGVISYFMFWYEEGVNIGMDWEDYGMGISNHTENGIDGYELINHTRTGELTYYSTSLGGMNQFYPSEYRTFKYAYSSQGGQPILVLVTFWGTVAVSTDWGETWSEPVFPTEHYSAEEEISAFLYSEVAMDYGPEGSSTIAVANGQEIWRSKDNGATFQISYGYEDALGSGLWDPADCNAHVGWAYTLHCNKKQDPECVWIQIAELGGGLDNPEKLVQRNLTPTCEVGGWEDQAYFLVSEAFQDDIFEGTCFYPLDHPSTGARGDPRTHPPVTIGIKYLPGTGRWWAFEMGHFFDAHWLVFSDDDGVTWSKILCDHATESNWEYMHPFFSPRKWPFNESYQLMQEMGGSGWQHNVRDIIEHPDDPQIVISMGECWLKTTYAVSDPAGRFGGTFEPVRRVWTEEADFLAYPEYNPWGQLESMGGNELTCLSISKDGGLTWGHPFSITPYWGFSNQDEIQHSRLVVVNR